ncbi:uncharacterized protein MONOS_7678 [Monocercomonoides exilis]|uniref:uncharacterized protein n=1 Tax=Monocercomonoides exilis TaxID=2049356 RepID=UPI00355A8666|nr:hypothetical protein MONOS_7678 [Monocercomonoides exilis]|eukprot:MONOS_7678.1-p1 / transcript=MONOS_7678.1 / gene=MONOS_7678 / organism=Monocercomonoides_exilis_PA203 / gene_product=unspecified product / transcript_product=unspecified product / location=Mono_scaffold00268:55537-56293(-) / protein_length=206 / sequence_SO=supercontig / SO=protein_coding / is_pseudo=false
MVQGMEHPPLLPQPSALSQPGADAQGGTAQAGTLRASLTDSSTEGDTEGVLPISKEKREHPKRERGERAALCRKTERRVRESNSSEMNMQRETAAPGEMRSETEVPKQHLNIGETVNSLVQRRERERETTGDRAIEISREDVQHDATRTEGDSAYPRVTGQTSEKGNEKIVWRASGTVIESPIGSALEVSSKTAIADTLEGEGNA